MSYLIIQDSRKNKGMNLALVDRSKSPDQWWTSVLDNALVFITKEQVKIQCDKYKYNNPRVVPFDIAKNEIKPIVTVTYQKVKRRKNIFDMNIYEYKEWLGYSDAIEYGGESGFL